MPVARRSLDLNQVAPWEVNQEPDQGQDPVPSDLPAWHPGLVHRAAWERPAPVQAAWEHQGQVHPATWGRPVAAWERLERIHQAAREHLVEPGGHPGQDHPAAWAHLGRVHPVAWGHPVAVRGHPVGWDHLGERDHLGEWVQGASSGI